MRALIATVGFVVASTAAQAGYFITHHLKGLTAAGSPMTNIVYFNSGPSSSFVFAGGAGPGLTAGPGDTTFADPFERASFSPKTGFIGLNGGAVEIGLSKAAGLAALGAAWEDFFLGGFTEASIHAALTGIGTGPGAARTAGLATLGAFYSANLGYMRDVTDVELGYIMLFTSGAKVGEYGVGQVFSPAAVPEPFTMLLGAAAAGLGAIRQRRRKMAA